MAKVGTIEKYKGAVEAFRNKVKEADRINKELAVAAREQKRLANQNQNLAIQASQQNTTLLKNAMSQNSRTSVAGTLFLSSVVAAGTELGANGFVHWLATPAKDATAPNIVLRNLGFFESLPSMFMGAIGGGWATYRAGQPMREYGAGDEFLRQLSAAWLAVGMVRGGDALLKPLPAAK